MSLHHEGTRGMPQLPATVSYILVNGEEGETLVAVEQARFTTPNEYSVEKGDGNLIGLVGVDLGDALSTMIRELTGEDWAVEFYKLT